MHSALPTEFFVVLPSSLQLLSSDMYIFFLLFFELFKQQSVLFLFALFFPKPSLPFASFELPQVDYLQIEKRFCPNFFVEKF